METKDKAEEITDYFFTTLGKCDDLSNDNFRETETYKEMVKEVEFMLDTN